MYYTYGQYSDIYSDNIIKIEDFSLDNILIDEKSYKKFLFASFHAKL